MYEIDANGREFLIVLRAHSYEAVYQRLDAWNALLMTRLAGEVKIDPRKFRLCKLVASHRQSTLALATGSLPQGSELVSQQAVPCRRNDKKLHRICIDCINGGVLRARLVVSRWRGMQEERVAAEDLGGSGRESRIPFGDQIRRRPRLKFELRRRRSE